MSLVPKVYYFYKLTKKEFVKKLSTVILLLVFTIGSAFSPALSNQNVDTNAKIKAVFIYNFTKYIEWPSDYQTGEFTIGILGENPALFKELDNMSKVKKVANRDFRIQSIESVEDLKKQHILYIPKGNNISISLVNSKLKGKSTLLVTEAPGLAKQGAAINFIIVGNRQKFELNKTTVSNHNLKVSSTLEKLSVLVN
ncbi:MAG: YfiR family protein [Flavobacteriales bacterium]|nr:YfiR family protein [Flavobacteriales bacterium]